MVSIDRFSRDGPAVVSGQEAVAVGADASLRADMGEPLVSIIVPCFNQAAFLGDAIDSIKAQSVSNWECVIVDDGSTDSTALLAAEFARADSRIRVIRQTNGGVSAARNAGILNSRGALIQFLDGDDVLLPEKLSRQLAILAAKPEVAAVGCDFEFFEHGHPERRTPSPAHYRLKFQTKDLLDALISGNFIHVGAPLIRREALDTVGGFDTTLVGCEDYELWLRFAVAGLKFSWIPDSLVLYRVTGKSASRARLRMLRSMVEVLIRLPDIASLDDPQRCLRWRYTIREYCRYTAVELCNSGRKVGGVRARCVAFIAPIVGRFALGRAILSAIVRLGLGPRPSVRAINSSNSSRRRGRAR